MTFYYIRHGKPIYEPDSLTELGKKQAEALAKKFAIQGLDKIFASTSERATLTAQPICDLLETEMTKIDDCNEKYVWESMTAKTDYGKDWLFLAPQTVELFTQKEVLDLGFDWYRHPKLKEYGKGMERIYDLADKMLLSLGYEHERYTGRYKAVENNDEKVALFAHLGFGMAFLSCVLDIPYPLFSTMFNLGHTGITAIEFKMRQNGFCIPYVKTLSSEAHLYSERIPVTY